MTNRTSIVATLASLLFIGGGLSAASPSRAEVAVQICSTIPQASTVIDSSKSQRSLVEAVAQTVPTDPPSCVPSYCEASLARPEEVRMAVGAGLAEAFATAEDEDAARLINNLACSLSCDGVVAKSYATSRADTLDRICGATYGDGDGGVTPSLFQINASGGAGGGGAVSPN